MKVRPLTKAVFAGAILIGLVPQAYGQTPAAGWAFDLVAEATDAVDNYTFASTAVRQWGPTNEVFILSERGYIPPETHDLQIRRYLTSPGAPPTLTDGPFLVDSVDHVKLLLPSMSLRNMGAQRKVSVLHRQILHDCDGDGVPPRSELLTSQAYEAMDMVRNTWGKIAGPSPSPETVYDGTGSGCLEAAQGTSAWSQDYLHAAFTEDQYKVDPTDPLEPDPPVCQVQYAERPDAGGWSNGLVTGGALHDHPAIAIPFSGVFRALAYHEGGVHKIIVDIDDMTTVPPTPLSSVDFFSVVGGGKVNWPSVDQNSKEDFITVAWHDDDPTSFNDYIRFSTCYGEADCAAGVWDPPADVAGPSRDARHVEIRSWGKT
jgi:hypothetical protein